MKIILKLRNILTNLKGIIKTVNNNLAANNNNKEIYWCLLEIQNELDKLKQDIIKDRTENAEDYAELEELRINSLAEMYKNNHNNWTGD